MPVEWLQLDFLAKGGARLSRLCSRDCRDTTQAGPRRGQTLPDSAPQYAVGRLAHLPHRPRARSILMELYSLPTAFGRAGANPARRLVVAVKHAEHALNLRRA